MTDIPLLCLPAGDTSVETFHERFKEKKPVEILMDHPIMGASYKIRDDQARYVVVRVDSFSRDYKGKNCWWCTVTKMGWMS